MSAIVRLEVLRENWPDDSQTAYLPDFDPVLFGNLILGPPDNELTIPRVDLLGYIDLLISVISLAAAFPVSETTGGEPSTSVSVSGDIVTLKVATLPPAKLALAPLTRGLGEALIEIVSLVAARRPELLANSLLGGRNYVRAIEVARARGAALNSRGALRMRFEPSAGDGESSN